MVRTRTHRDVPAPGVFHCRSYSGIRQSGGRDEILRGECEKVVVLYGCRCVRGYIGRVFLYDTSTVYEHLQTRRRVRPGNRVPLFRPGDQHTVDYPHVAHTRY